MSTQGAGAPNKLSGVNYKGKRLIGKVVDNNDPNQFRRLKVEIKELWDCPTADLPWCIPDTLCVAGNTNTCGGFGVPIVGSIVYVTLQDGDPHFPMWVGMPTNQQTKLSGVAATNYPHRYGIMDNKGNYWYVDRQTDDYEFYHKSGTKIHIDPDGKVTVTAVSDLTGTVAGDMTWDVTGTATYKAASHSFEGPITADSTIDADGDVTGQGTSLHTHTHGGVDTGSGDTDPPN